MGNLVPGVLLKLLEQMKSEGRVTGEHRSTVLQVVSIVPALTGGDIFVNKGFHLKVSDSSHATYVSLPVEESELILSDKLRLGQLINVQRIEYGSPLPILRGVNPVPGRHPCVGSPLDVFATHSISLFEGRAALLPPRLSLDSSMEINALFNNRSKSIRSDLKLPSSMWIMDTQSVAKAETKKATRSEIANGGTALRKSWDDVAKIVKASTNVFLKKKPSESSYNSSSNVNTKPSIAKYNSKDKPSINDFNFNLKISTNLRSSREEMSSKKKNNVTCDSSSQEELTNLRNTLYGESMPKPSSKKAVVEETWKNGIPRSFARAPISSRKVTHESISWASVPSSLAKHGKEVMKKRDAAHCAAMEAMLEASASERLLRCLSLYACILSKIDDPQRVVEDFMKLHKCLKEFRAEAGSEEKSLKACKNAERWVDAALISDMSRFSVYSSNDKCKRGSQMLMVLEDSTVKPASAHGRSQQAAVPKLVATGAIRKSGEVSISEEGSRRRWIRGSGIDGAGELAERLRIESREWFLVFVERFLDAKADFFLTGNEQIVGTLSQLKSVSDWLDEIQMDDEMVLSVLPESVESLKRKIYNYLMTRVEPVAAQIGK